MYILYIINLATIAKSTLEDHFQQISSNHEQMLVMKDEYKVSFLKTVYFLYCFVVFYAIVQRWIKVLNSPSPFFLLSFSSQAARDKLKSQNIALEEKLANVTRGHAEDIAKIRSSLAQKSDEMDILKAHIV